MNRETKLAPLGWRFSDEDVQSIMNSLVLEKDNDMPAGVFYPIWWVTNGHLFYKTERGKIIETIRIYMQRHYSFDGLIVDYPRGGEVLVLWKFNKTKPKQIK